MIEVKNFSGGMNLDASRDAMPPNDYLYALNITHDAVEGGNDQDITNIVANRIGDATYTLPAGTNKTIGAIANTLRDTIIHFLCNSNGYHRVIEFNKTTRLHDTVFENLTDSDDVDVLGFTEHDKISSVNIYNRDEGDLLYFLDSLGRPTQMDIALYKAGEYTPVTRAILDKGKKPPLSPPSVVYDNDTDRRSNNFRNKLMRFKYRWIYDDFEKSTFSPISVVPLPINILSETYSNVVTNNNVIRLIAKTGDKNVKAIELAMSYVEKTNDWSDFLSIGILEKASLGLRVTTITGANPFGAGSTLVYATLGGTPVTGDVVNAYLTLLPSTRTLVGTYTVLDGDTLEDIQVGLVASLVSTGIAQTPFGGDNVFVFGWLDVTYSFDEIEIVSTPGALDNGFFPYAFYNDSTYPVIPVDESIQLFDLVPDIANTQEMPNGNILTYAGITEGYDKDTLPNAAITIGTVAAGNGGAIGSLYYVMTRDGQPSYLATFSGIPATGTIVNIKIINNNTSEITTITSYTTLAGDTAADVVSGLIATGPFPDIISLYPYGGYPDVLDFQMASSDYNFNTIEIISPTTDGASSSVATWKWSTERSFARAYFDEKGKTNGILYTDKATFPAYAENGSQQPLIPFVNYKIYDIPPAWAYSMQFYVNKDASNSIFWTSILANKDEARYIYFDITSFQTNASKKPSTAVVLSYTYKEGDRIRLIRNTDSPGIVYDDTYDTIIEGVVTDPIINTIPKTGTFIKIANISPFTTAIDVTKDYVIEIYSPAQQTANSSNQVYYEFGEQYDIIDPTLPERRHSGEVTDQVVGVTPAEFNFYEGDYYFRGRTIVVSDTGTGYVTFNVMDRNFVDYYNSAVSSIDGRPNIIDLNARRAYYSTLIRHGEAYQANTNINGLNRFYSKNFDEYDYSYGDVMRLKVRERQLRVFQKYKVGVVPLYSSIGKDNNGAQVVFQTDKLLNPIQYYVGNFGIGDLSESLSSNNFADYFCDNVTGTVLRVSNDGVTPLSIIYKANSWANKHLPLRTGNYKVYGAFDRRLNNYILALEYVPTDSPAQTLVFDEEQNRFESFMSFQPEMMVTLGTMLCCFKNGVLWTHDDEPHYNNFFGTQYDSYITPVFNKQPIDKKSFQAIEVVASQAWDCPEIITSSNAYGSTKQTSNLIVDDFDELEANYSAAFLGASNSIGGVIEGDSLKGNLMSVQLRAINPAPPNNNLISLSSATVLYKGSPLNPR